MDVFFGIAIAILIVVVSALLGDSNKYNDSTNTDSSKKAEKDIARLRELADWKHLDRK